MFSLPHHLLRGHPVSADESATPAPGNMRTGTTPRERTLLDLVMPDHHFRGKVVTSVDATPEETLRALEEVTLAEIPLVGAIHSLRSLPDRLPGRARSHDDHRTRPLIEVAGPLRLGDDPGREIVLGFVGQLHKLRERELVHLPDLFTFTRFNDADHQKLAMNIRAEPEPDGRGSRLTSEHRTLALSASSRRRFAVSWYLITGWGGNLMLRMLLRAVKRRAEADHRAVPRGV